MNNIVIIISTDNEIFSVKKDLKELSAFFKKNKIYAGISSKFQNITHSKKYLRESFAALNYGMDSRREQNIFCYDDFRIEHILHSATDGSLEISSSIISSIQKYDRENSSVLLDTLYIYLLYGMNFNITLEQTGITSKELSDSLKELENIFYIDWTNGNMLFNIFLTIKFFNKV